MDEHPKPIGHLLTLGLSRAMVSTEMNFGVSDDRPSLVVSSGLRLNLGFSIFGQSAKDFFASF